MPPAYARPGWNRRLATILAVVLVPLGVLVGCGSEKDEARSAATADGFNVVSDAFEEGANIPAVHTLDGDNTSPPLAWFGVPADTVELAITVVDPDASNFAHWIVWGIDPDIGTVEAGSLPAGAVAGLNQLGETGWSGPAPPAGEEHTYVFTVHALSRSIHLPADTPVDESLAAIDAATLAEAQLRGQFAG